MKIDILASGSSGNAYLVDDGTTRLLLDAGITYKELQRRSGYTLSSVSGCLLTHEHGDHAKAVNDLMRYGMNLYTASGTATVLGISGHRVKIVKLLEEFEVGSYHIRPFPLYHDAAQPIGFVIRSVQSLEKLLYFTDTARVEHHFREVTHLIAECNFTVDRIKERIESDELNPRLAMRIAKSHMSLEVLKQYIATMDQSRLQKIILAHLSNSNSDEEVIKREIEQLTGVLVEVA